MKHPLAPASGTEFWASCPVALTQCAISYALIMSSMQEQTACKFRIPKFF